MRSLALCLLTACGASAPPPAPPTNTAPAPVEPPLGEHVVRGVLKFPSGAKSGTAIFLLARQRDAQGNPTGVPLAVNKLTYAGGDLPFVLDETMSMAADAPLVGDVLIVARYDLDADAVTKAAGDFIGQAPAHVPATGIVVNVTTPLSN